MTTTPAGRLKALTRAEFTLLGRSKGVLFTAVFVPLVLPFSVSRSVDESDLLDAGLNLGVVLISSTIAFSLLFAVYSSLVSVYAARREELVLKRLRTGELRDAEILAGAAVPSVVIGLAQCGAAAVVCATALDAGAPEAPQLVLLGLVLGIPLCVALAAYTTVFSRSVESAQVAAMPMLIVSMFASGAVVPLEVLPDKLASVCEVLPLTSALTLVRGGWGGTLSGGEAVRAAAVAVAWIAVAVFAVRKRFRWEPRR
ncbi:ABC transporter permease [Streptomyces sp. VRA16 Mangrove soil]|uniref:ABC transporter permease n=1 Tax=Streptomyces sp. VRA16 Mangrove soil TaxID=2817434 RepID=UPI001A9EE58E|nr:ABC transporter permease [Streptomyces sp. VRA16 Mangrove soil]MBO1337348.1 ABC transporter permease [Streptomyces sp. VRA16 Mangrove soil]